MCKTGQSLRVTRSNGILPPQFRPPLAYLGVHKVQISLAPIVSLHESDGMSVFKSLLLAMLLPWRCACYFLFAILLRINDST